MFELRASAPGKLVLAGEYAVIDGASALSTAVNCRATAVMTELRAAHCELHIVNNGVTLQFDCAQNGALHWHDESGAAGSILAAVVGTLTDLGLWRQPGNPFRLALDSRKFYRQQADGEQRKLGLGSSAAMTVAVTGLLLKYLGAALEYPVFLAAHRRLQQGLGSGIDVATSYSGGVIAYSRSADAPPEMRGLGWPQGLHVLPVWTGQPVSTAAMLDRLAAFKAKQNDLYERLMSELCAASSLTVAQWDAGQPDALMAAMQDFADRLQTLDTAAEVGIWSPSHRELGKAAAEKGIVYKPSGAGGGDCGLAFSQDSEQLGQLAKEYTRLGYELPDLEMGGEGLKVSGAS